MEIIDSYGIKLNQKHLKTDWYINSLTKGMYDFLEPCKSRSVKDMDILESWKSHLKSIGKTYVVVDDGDGLLKLYKEKR